MKQTSIFATSSCHWELFVDGAARNNPGPAGAGIYLTKDGVDTVKEGFFLGNKTNNQAEYLALILGLLYVKDHACADDNVTIKSDSQLLVRQLQGAYRVKNQELILLYKHAQDLLSSIKYLVIHIPREENKIADKLANDGIDKKKLIPREFVNLWHIYEKSL